MAPPTKKRRRSPYGCADAVTSLLDTLVTNEAEASTTATAATKRRLIVFTPQAAQAMMICHERFLQILAAELAMGAEGEDPSAAQSASTSTADKDAATARSATGMSVVQPAHVMSAIQQLGWEESAPPVVMPSKKSKQAKSQLKRAPVSSSAPKRRAKERVRNKKREWTTEELAAQERLIAASREKLKGQTEA
jgi:hypothetical protein